MSRKKPYLILSTSSIDKAIAVCFAGSLFLSACAAARPRTVAVADLQAPPAAQASMHDLRVAVLPVQNLSGRSAPLKEIQGLLTKGLTAGGFRVLDERLLEEFMAGYRMRYVGGIDGAAGRALRDKTGAGAVLISSLELYNDETPPRMSLTSRLVSTGDSPVILWMDSVAMGGDDSPGFLDLGLIADPRILLGKVVRSLSESLADSATGRARRDSARAKRGKFEPKLSYRSSGFAPGSSRTVAVLPFVNESLRKNGGEIMMLHLVEEMARQGSIKVIEPGVVRRELLTYRIILEDGISLANADTVFGAVDADLLLTGNVSNYRDYQGYEGEPVVDFSVFAIERKSREVVWSSKSYNKGTDGVYFFDCGRERTASSMASEMARIIRERMWQ